MSSTSIWPAVVCGIRNLTLLLLAIVFQVSCYQTVEKIGTPATFLDPIFAILRASTATVNGLRNLDAEDSLRHAGATVFSLLNERSRTVLLCL